MFLEKLSLEHVRCFDHLELSFIEEKKAIRQRTILLGDNGLGKSTILKSIALVMAGSTGLGQLLGDSDKWIHINSPECTIKATIQTAKKEQRIITLNIKRGDNLRKIISRNKTSLEDLEEISEQTQGNYLTIGYGVSRRIGQKLIKQKVSNYTGNQADNVATLFDSDAVLFPLEAWVMDLDYRGETKGLAIVKSALNQLLLDYKFDSIDKKNKQLLFKTKQGLIPFSDLSDGYKISASWLGDLLYRITQTYEDYKSPLKAKFCLLVDELGLHLHPKWQRKILFSLQKLFPNAQIISTTHSPFIAQQANSGELFTLVFVQKKIQLFQYNNDPKQLLIHQIIMSDIFGLETDESFEVEKAKAQYRKDKKSGKAAVKSRGMTTESEETAALKSRAINTNSPGQILFNEEYNQLMEQLKQELKKKQK